MSAGYRQSSDLLREIHPAHKILEARIRAQTVHSEVSSQEVRKVRGPFLVRFFEVFEGFVLFSQAGVDRCNHIRRNIASFRLTQPSLEDFPRLSLSACGCIRVCQLSSRI